MPVAVDPAMPVPWLVGRARSADAFTLCWRFFGAAVVGRLSCPVSRVSARLRCSSI